MNLLNESSNSKFVTRKWDIVKDESSGNYDSENKIVYKTDALKSSIYDHNDALTF